MVKNTQWNKDFVELLVLLNENHVRYLLIGSYAAGYYGTIRYTRDIDFLVEPTEENATALMNALTAFGFGNAGFTKEDFLNDEMVVQLGVEPNRIDFLMSIPGVVFSTAWQNKAVYDAMGVPVNVIGIDDLIRNKEAVGRPKDLGDADLLRKAKKGDGRGRQR